MSHKEFSFKIEKSLGEGTLARAGVIKTPHGEIRTPAFITVGTAATVKAVTPEAVADAGAQAVLANTYHLYLRPGADIVAQGGGVGKFMNWSGPTFTDSGGFQVFSLGVAYKKGIGKVSSSTDIGDATQAVASKQQLAKIDEDGVSFISHIDGSRHRLTPETSMQIQHQLGADITFAFDECTAPLAPLPYQRQALERTERWAARSLREHQRLTIETLDKPYQALFGVIQGARYEELRREAATALGAMDFDGYGIGGAFDKEDIGTAVRWVNEELPEDKPRHLLGIGEVVDLFEGIENGVDTFDCVSPTRLARNGGTYTKTGRINLRNAEFGTKFAPIEADCTCYTCTNYTCAYLSHLFRANEMLVATLVSIHNLHFIITLVDQIRESIIGGSFFELKQKVLMDYYGKI
jgi:queuine tRNA-ribosyltransferase